MTLLVAVANGEREELADAGREMLRASSALIESIRQEEIARYLSAPDVPRIVRAYK